MTQESFRGNPTVQLESRPIELPVRFWMALDNISAANEMPLNILIAELINAALQQMPQQEEH